MTATERSFQNRSEIDALQAEVERLRAIVGPSENSYLKLAQDALGAREAAMKAEIEAGRARAQIVELENEVRRWQRDFVWFRNGIVRRVPLAQRLLASLPNPKRYARPVTVRCRALLARFTQE